MSLRPTVAVALALLGAACAGNQGVYDAAGEPLPDSIYVDALNDNFYDARIHAVYTGGQRRTLGTLAGNGGHLEQALGWEPHALVFVISFIISGRTYVSHPVDVSRGERVELRLPPNIDQSGFFRRVSR
ncbi:MAG TPA: hypothetical protein VMM12_11505 [Longimicrobiales bacterium]|nr:hypothetical protein [Longimicrobiales bacterium]